MKRNNPLKKLISLVLTFCMLFSFSSYALANESGPIYADFAMQQKVIEQINAEYGLNIQISPLSEEDMENAEPMLLADFITFFTEYAVGQQGIRDFMEDNSSPYQSIVPTHGTYLPPRTYSGGTSLDNINVSGQITADVYNYNNLIHAHAAYNGRATATSSSLPNFTHNRTQFISATLNNPTADIIYGHFISEVSWSFVYAFFYDPDFRTTITFYVR